jgi:hypothetical protein
MRGPAEELKREHQRLGRQLTVREAIAFLESRDAEAAHLLKELGSEYLERPIFIHGESGRIRTVRPGEVYGTSSGVTPLKGHPLTYVRIETDDA